jgi:hypothetical protein
MTYPEEINVPMTWGNKSALIVFFSAYIAALTTAFKVKLPRTATQVGLRRSTAFSAKVQKAEDESVQVTEEGENIEGRAIPFDGVVGRENGALFDKPLNVYDPLKDTGDLPGEDGSAEKIAAIQARIENRVAELKKAGEWGDEGDAFGTDPLAKQSLVATMSMQLKACKPFETTDELALTFILVLVTTVVLSAYLVVLRDSFDAAANWFINTDFDADFLSTLF